MARVDVVALHGAGVAGDDGEVFARDAEGGTAVVGVAGEELVEEFREGWEAYGLKACWRGLENWAPMVWEKE